MLPARAENNLSRRSAVCGFGVLLLWGLSRLGGAAETRLLPRLSPVAGAMLSLLIYCIMMGVPLVALCSLLPLPKKELLPLGGSRRGTPLFLLPGLAALILLNLLGWAFTDWLGAYFTLPPYAPSLGETAGEIAVNLLASTVLPAVMEELFFRGAVLHGLREAGSGRAVIISALLFMVCHGSVAQWVPALGGGLLFGWLAVRTGSLRQGVLLHFCYNLFAALTTLLPGDAVRRALPAVLVTGGIIAFVVLLREKVPGKPDTGPKGRARDLWSLPLLLGLLVPAASVFGTLTLL